MQSPAPAPDVTQSRPNPGPADRSPVLRVILVLGVVAMVASVLSLAALLITYFADQPPWPPLYGIVLTGLPVAFTLLVLYVALSAVLRSRVR